MKCIYTFLAFFFWVGTGWTQTPHYFSLEPRPALDLLELPPPADLPVETGQNPLFSAAIPVQWSTETAGQWMELGNGDRVWWLRVQSDDALGLAILFDRLFLPPGSSLQLFNPSGQFVAGPYTEAQNTRRGKFATDFVEGEELILEYYEPASVRGQGVLSIFRLDYGFDRGGCLGFGCASACHVNINCPEGAGWQDEKRSVVRIRVVVESGMGWCSGSLLNNVNNDGVPYVLTGFHCQDGYVPLYDFWRFDFGYEGAGCNNPPLEPSFQSLTGSTFRAGRQASDFLLVEINESVPLSYEPVFNGWDRTITPADSVFHIHHPRADIKKISIDQNPIIIHPSALNWNNGVTTPANHHWRIKWDVGTFEIGSSGAPLFTPEGRVIGQLHGGNELCTGATAYFGRFSISWDSGATPAERLKDWLDPSNTNAGAIDAYIPSGPTLATVSGRVATEKNNGIKGVRVQLGGFLTDTLWTDTSGVYSFDSLPIGQAYTITFWKDTLAMSGVTTSDQVNIRKHILFVDTLETPYRMIAADANNNGAISTTDMLAISKVILAIEDSFPNNTSWRFVPAAYEFPDPENPFEFPLPNVVNIPSLPGDLPDIDFIGIKIGDANVSANPDE